MECGSPVPPEALEEAGMPPRTGDNAENPREKSSPAPNSTDKNRASSTMPDISPVSAGDNDDSEDSSEKSLAFCKNCGTVMQSNPYTCEKCGEPLEGSHGGIPMFRNPDLLSEGMEDIGEDMNLSEMLGADGSPLDDEMDAEAAKMFGNLIEPNHSSGGAGTENQFSMADLEMLNMQMSKYSQSTSSEMPMVGRDMPEPEPPKPPQPPQPVDKDAPIIAEEEFIPESNDFGDFGDFTEESSNETGASVEPMQSNPVDLGKPNTPYPEPPKPVYSEPKPEVPNPAYSEPKPIPESPVIEEAPIIEEVPVIGETPESSSDSANSGRDDYLLPEENPQKPEMHMPKYMYFGIIIIIICITMGIILANVK